MVKNLAIEMSVDKIIKPKYLGFMVVVKKLQGGAYILAKLNGLVWQNKVVVFRVFSYLSRRKFDFMTQV